MLDLIIAFLCGAALTVILILAGLFVWFVSQPVINQNEISKGFEPLILPQLPQYLEDVFHDLNSPEGTGVSVESCRWLNLVNDFLFRELRDSTLVKRILMKKVNTEFEELLMTRTEGRLLEQLTVRDYFLGTSMPIIKDVSIVKIKCSSEDDKEPELIELAMHIDYSGGVEVKIDADLVFDKSAYVAVKVLSVKGRLRVIFTRLPSTHWSFTFYEEPELKLQVDSHFEGRSFPKLSSIIESQIRRFIRKKYVIPSAKMRHKPFFKKPKPQDQLMEVFVKDEKLTVGELQVEVVDCSRLVVMESAARTYCTLALDRSPYQPRVNLWRTYWPTHELVVTKDPKQRIGIHYRQVSSESDRSYMIVVDNVIPHSPAMKAGILIGDVLIRVDNVRVNSVKQVERLIQKTKGNSILVTLQRPPPHFNPLALSTQPPRSKTRSGDTAPHTEYTEEWDTLDQAEAQTGNEGPRLRPRTLDGDSISLCGVGGERRRPDQEEGLRRRVNTVTTLTEGRSATPDLVATGTSTPVEGLTHLISDLETPSVEPSPLQPRVRKLADPPLSSGRSQGRGAQQVTREVPARKNPSWKESFDLNITEEHNYLNVCVWGKLAADESGDLLIGHVTIPLMDIALQCLCTSSGYHHQRFTLVAAQTVKASASRATLQAKSSTASNPSRKEGGNKKKWESVFAGDIFLRFKHHPNPNTDKNSEAEAQVDPLAEENIATSAEPQHFARHPFMASEGHLPEDHDFAESQSTDGRQVCDICCKKIWSLKTKPMKCKKCGLKCHRKCAKYCVKEVPCKGGASCILQQSMEGDFTMFEVREEMVPPDRGDYGGHRRLKQQSVSNTKSKSTYSDSFEMVDDSQNKEKVNPDSAFVIVESSTKSESSANSTKDEGEDNVDAAKDEMGDSTVVPASIEREGGIKVPTMAKEESLIESTEVKSKNRDYQLTTGRDERGEREHEQKDMFLLNTSHSSDESEQLYTPPPEDSGDSSVEEDFISKYRLSSRMKVRGAALEAVDQERVINEIADKQIEIEQYTELANTTAISLKDPDLSCTEAEDLRTNLVDYEEKIQSLSLSMKTKLQVADNFL